MTTPYRRTVLALPFLALAIANCSDQQPRKDQLLSQAREAFAAERYSEAEKVYLDVIRLTPGDPEAQRQLGLIYHDQGQIIRAFPLLQRAAKTEPDNLEVKLRLGLSLLMFGHFPKAREVAQEILDGHPGHEQALLLLASTSTTPAEAAETRTLIENLRGRDQARPSYHVALGMAAVRLKELERAETEIKAALASDPKDIWAHVGMGTLHWARGDLKAAKESFRTAAELSPARSPVPLRYADFLINTGATDEAKSFLDSLSTRASDYLPPRVALMKLACRQKRDDDCTSRVKEILTQDSTNYDALIEHGAISLTQGDFASAVRTFEYLSKIYTRNPQVQFQLALAYLMQAGKSTGVQSQNAIENAERSLTGATQLDPYLEQAVLLLAELKVKKGTPAAAIEPLTRLIKERPQNARAHYLLASAQLAQKNRAQALAIYRQMVELFPKDPQPPYLVGRIHVEQRQPLEARRAFNRSNEIAADYLPAVEALVNLDIDEGLYATATERLKRFFEKDPPQALPYVLRAKIHLAQKEMKSAEADLIKALELDPKIDAAYLLLSQLYLGSNKTDQAIDKLSAAVQQNKSISALAQLALIQQQQKNYPAARDAYETLLKAQPNSVLALNNLAVLYADYFGEVDKALEIARRAREVAPNDPRIIDTLGWTLFKKGGYANARRLLQESAGKLPDEPEIQFHLGMAHYMLGEEEPARAALQRAANPKSDFLGKEQVSPRLALLAIKPADSGARTKLESFLKEHPNDPMALMRLAEVLQAEGSADQATRTYEKVVADNPSFAPAVRRLASIYAQRSPNESRAFEIAQNARQAYPHDPEIAKILGVLNYHRALYPRAVDLLREASSKLPEDSELLYYLGQSHYQLKQPKDCQAVLERAISSSGANRFMNEAKRTLEQCTEMLTGQP